MDEFIEAHRVGVLLERELRALCDGYEECRSTGRGVGREAISHAIALKLGRPGAGAAGTGAPLGVGFPLPGAPGLVRVAHSLHAAGVVRAKDMEPLTTPSPAGVEVLPSRVREALAGFKCGEVDGRHFLRSMSGQVVAPIEDWFSIALEAVYACHLHHQTEMLEYVSRQFFVSMASPNAYFAIPSAWLRRAFQCAVEVIARLKPVWPSFDVRRPNVRAMYCFPRAALSCVMVYLSARCCNYLALSRWRGTPRGKVTARGAEMDAQGDDSPSAGGGGGSRQGGVRHVAEEATGSVRRRGVREPLVDDAVHSHGEDAQNSGALDALGAEEGMRRSSSSSGKGGSSSSAGGAGNSSGGGVRDVVLSQYYKCVCHTAQAGKSAGTQRYIPPSAGLEGVDGEPADAVGGGAAVVVVASSAGNKSLKYVRPHNCKFTLSVHETQLEDA
ncbi:hypothetical protein EON68_01205, partial [archaeon]